MKDFIGIVLLIITFPIVILGTIYGACYYSFKTGMHYSIAVFNYFK